MSGYSTAIHEAGHSVVAHALGIKFGKRGVTIIPSKNGRSAGLVQTVKLSRHSMTDNIAHILAGGMAVYRVTPKQTEELNSLFDGIAGDVSHIASDLTYDVLVQESRKGRRFNAEYQTAFLAAQRLRETKDAIPNPIVQDIYHSAFILCISDTTEAAIQQCKPDVAIRITQSQHFKLMAESAMIARRILNERWESVLALANHLLEVRKMTGTELTTFLNEQAEAVEAKVSA